MGQPINIKIELTITDQRGGAAPAKKTVSVIVADRSSGLIRSESFSTGIGNVQLHVDAEPRIIGDGKIRLRFGLTYDSPPSGESPRAIEPPASDMPAAASAAAKVAIPTRAPQTQIRENLALVLENGKSILATQSADPVSDRQVTVEVKATILR